MFLPMLMSFVLASILGQNFIAAALLGVLFFLILGLKELVFIDRRLASESMIFLILSAAGFLLYESADAWSAWAAVKIFIFAWMFWALAGGFLERKEISNPKSPLVLGVMSFLLFEISMVIAFLPLDFLYQAAIAIFTAFIFFEWLTAYSEERLEKNKILFYASFLFILATLIFSFAAWSV